MQHRTVAVLFLGHLVTDINQGALPALLPFLIAEYHLSYTAAAFIIFASNVASSVVQPMFGHLADRASTPWLMPAGIVLAGMGLAGTGIVTHYTGVLVSVMLSGIGVAAFHPQGAQYVNRVSGEGKATAMSFFGVGGTLGFAIGPGLVTAVLLHWGVKGAALMVGGRRPDRRRGYYYPATVLAHCRHQTAIMQQEIFGPVLPITTFTDLDEAIELANDCEYGLASSVYTRDLDVAIRACREITFGETYINRQHREAKQGFHAGCRKSGIGGSDGKHGLEEYLQTHVVYLQYDHNKKQ